MLDFCGVFLSLLGEDVEPDFVDDHLAAGGVALLGDAFSDLSDRL